MNHPFKISDKIICINHDVFEGDRPFDKGDDIPIIGKIYVVSNIDFIDNIPVCDLIGMKLAGDEFYDDYHYTAWNFRKLDDIKEENRLKQTVEI